MASLFFCFSGAFPVSPTVNREIGNPGSPVGPLVPIHHHYSNAALTEGMLAVRGEFIKSSGNRRLVQPATVLLPAIRSKAYR
jgi:hypothetical protein